MADFTQFKAQENMHIVVSAKDFKSIVAHADTLDTLVGAYYSTPGRPLQFSYSKDGLHCQFTLMTVGDYSGTPAPSAATSTVSRNTLQAPSNPASAVQNGRIAVSEMPPPAIPNARKSVRKLGQNGPQNRKQKANEQDQDSDSLFVPRDGDDREDVRWDPADYENEEETLGWDASANNVRTVQ
jgi:cell cycle checkpoint control protein RAD9A